MIFHTSHIRSSSLGAGQAALGTPRLQSLPARHHAGLPRNDRGGIAEGSAR